MTAIGPHYTSEMFPNGLSLDDKISVFEDRVRGWQLNQAEYLLENNQPHSAFAALHIVMSYFESIAKFRYGHRSKNDGSSKKYFRLGFEWVFDDIKVKIPDKSNRKDVLNDLYDKARSGLYHAGITGAGFVITANTSHVLEVYEGLLVLNPHILVPALNLHLSMYVSELRKPANTHLRKCFEYRFDWLRDSDPKDEPPCEKPSED